VHAQTFFRGVALHLFSSRMRSIKDGTCFRSSETSGPIIYSATWLKNKESKIPSTSKWRHFDKFVWRNFGGFCTSGGKSQFSTWQIAIFNLTNCNFELDRPQLSTVQIATFSIANHNFWYLDFFSPSSLLHAGKSLNVCVVSNCQKPYEKLWAKLI
jgi:hypothetical protein